MTGSLPETAEPYAYALDQCDVQDRDALAEYRKKRQEWLFWLKHDEHHNIWLQISSMVWSDMAFRVLNRARRPAAEGEEIGAHNGLLGRMIDQGFVASQILSIRKLTEPNNDRQPKKGVISLRRLLDDLRAHRHLLTRETYVAHDGLPYDYAEVERRWLENHVKTTKGVWVGYLPTTGPEAFDISRMMHESFDRIARVDASNRSRFDRIPESIFDTLDRWLAAGDADKIIRYGNKFVAHAADPVSRGAAPLASITMDQVAQAHRQIIRVAQAISTDVLYDSGRGSVVPTPQYDPLAGLELPYASPNGLADLQGYWDQCVAERDQWLEGVCDSWIAETSSQ